MLKRFEDFLKEATVFQYFTGKNTAKGFLNQAPVQRTRAYDSSTYKDATVSFTTNKVKGVRKESEEVPKLDINLSDDILALQSFEDFNNIKRFNQIANLIEEHQKSKSFTYIKELSLEAKLIFEKINNNFLSIINTSFSESNPKEYKDLIKIINEKRTQLNIPFDKSDPLHGKMHHEHVQDALEDMQIMKPEQYKSKGDYDVEDVIDCEIPKVVKGLSQDVDRIRDQVTMFIYDNLKDNTEYWKPEFITDNDLDLEDDDVYQDAVEEMAIEDLSEEGLEAWNQFFENQTSDDIYSMVDTITDSIKENDGLIAVWRAITFDKGEYDDVYDAMIKGYKKGIGVYWSWEESAAEAHCSSGGKLFVIHGLVRPEDVDWEATVLKTIYELKEEEEIEIKSAGAIKLIGMSTEIQKGSTPTRHTRGKDHYIEFETPYVVKV